MVAKEHFPSWKKEQVWGYGYADMCIIVLSLSTLTWKEEETEGFPLKRLDRQLESASDT